MIYLVFLVLLAGGGILKLWLYQRRHSRLDNSVDEFWSGLREISHQPVPGRRPVARRGEPGPARAVRPAVVRTGARPAPLDPARRAAAKRRIEARRRAMGRAAG